MKKRNSYFLLHDFFRRKIFIEDAWCGFCDETDPGLFGADEFEVYGDKFILGYCRNCGTKIVSEINEKNIV
jgi:hypothetical protein